MPENPLRVGTDLVLVADVAAAVDRYGSRYLDRLFTPHEVASCAGEPAVAAAGLAARFAAKEATIKVLRPAGDPPGWREIEVRRSPSGACDLRLTGHAARLAARSGLGALAVSLTHEAGLAAAVVVATTDTAPEEAA